MMFRESSSASASTSSSPSGHAVAGLAEAGAPLVDQRSLWSSIGIHALFLLLVLAIPTPQAASLLMPQPGAMQAEVTEVDNRVSPPVEPGGAPKELGGAGEVAVEVRGPGGDSAQAQALSSLIKQIAPNASNSADVISSAIPLPSSSGLGAVPGAGLGGGGGAGGGSGGGSTGRSLGPGTEFFGTKENGLSFLYVIDCSGSMAHNQALVVAKAELTVSLGRLAPEAQFGAVFYNLRAKSYAAKLLGASNGEKEKFKQFLKGIAPSGGTDHMTALRKALELKPEVVFFLTDADLMTEREVEEILKEVGATRVHAVQFGVGADLSNANPLKKLARATNGSYRYIDTNTFVKGN